MITEEVRIQIRNIEDRAYSMMYYNQKLRSAKVCRRIDTAKRNDIIRLLDKYASTKAEEVAIEFYLSNMYEPTEDSKKVIKAIFDEWYTQYKLSQI